MIKFILITAVAILSLAATLAGLLAINGKLSTETLQALTNPEQYAEMEAKKKAEMKTTEPALGTLAQQLNERSRQLDERESALAEREKQVKQREDDLDKARTDLETLQKTINESLDVAAESRATQLKTVAITLESMEPQSAAERLASMPTDEIAEILMNVKDKKRGEILEVMETELAARVIKEIRDVR